MRSRWSRDLALNSVLRSHSAEALARSFAGTSYHNGTQWATRASRRATGRTDVDEIPSPTRGKGGFQAR